MSQTITALIIKFIMTLVIAGIVFSLMNGNNFGWILIVSIAGTILNYLMGDLFVLPNLGNIVASLGDGLMAALTAYIIDLTTLNFATSLSSLAIFGILIAIGEYFFHQYLIQNEKVAP
ncbi:DUF2512 family protein [Selenihalanaerobacter shriftii]|uniref:4 TMS phage holin, superfamily IV n=1 Tax=Selenihalanaerobacter shriftii TaxID=142842 RepID=A0A1T4NU33_9FIRM|nr:DUF2512 family protein [Selenihalanaerobacter shriftii]SJZ82779.1 Protein of unknown function [Selenihalanaerobacter shriftii]